MPFCPSCGTSADGKFCPKCGTAIAPPAGGGASYNAPPQGMGYQPPPPQPPPPGYQQQGGYQPPPPGYQQGGYQQPPPGQPLSAPGLQPNIASMLCYIVMLVCPIIFLVVEPYKSDRKIRFDAFQSLFLFGAFILANIVLGIVVGFSYHLWFLYRLMELAEFAICAFMAYKCYQNEKFVLPVIGQIAEKQA